MAVGVKTYFTSMHMCEMLYYNATHNLAPLFCTGCSFFMCLLVFTET